VKNLKRALIIAIIISGLTLILLYYTLRHTQGNVVYHYLKVMKKGMGTIEVNIPKGSGERLASGLFKVTNGSRVGLVIRADRGWEIKWVEVNGEKITYPLNTTKVELSIPITSNTTVEVELTKIPEYELRVLIEGEGTVDVNRTTAFRGESISAIIRPAEGWFIESVRLDGEDLGAVDRLSIEMWSDRVLEVKFHRWAYLNITVKGNATLEIERAELVNGIYRVPEGTINVNIRGHADLREEWFIQRIVLDNTVLFEFNRSQAVVEKTLTLNATGYRRLVVELYRVAYVILRIEIIGNGTAQIEGYRDRLEENTYRVESSKTFKVYFKPSNWFWLFRKAQIIGKGEILELHKDCIVVVLEEDSTIRLTFEKRKLPEGIRGYVTDRPVSLYRGTKIMKVNKTTYIIDGGDFVVDAFIPLEKEWYRIKVKVVVEVVPLKEEGKRSPIELFLGGFVGADEENRPDYHGVRVCAIGGFEALIELWREEWMFIWEEYNKTWRPKIKYKIKFNGTLDPRYTRPVYPSGWGGSDIPMGYNMIYVQCQDSMIPMDAWVKVTLIILELE